MEMKERKNKTIVSSALNKSIKERKMRNHQKQCHGQKHKERKKK
jgi:hypothetical protein